MGYWTSRQAQSSADVRTSISSNSSDVPSRAGSPQPSASPAANDEEVNLEYLRNVIMQFLEHKEMRVRTFDIVDSYQSLSLSGLAQPRESLVDHTTFHTTGNKKDHCEGLSHNGNCISSRKTNLYGGPEGLRSEQDQGDMLSCRSPLHDLMDIIP